MKKYVLTKAQHFEMINAMRKFYNNREGIFDPEFSFVSAQHYGRGYYDGLKILIENNA